VQLITGASGASSLLAAPTLNLPASITTLAANGSIRVTLPTTPTLTDGLVGTSTTDTLTVIMAVSGGPSGAVPKLSSALGNGTNEGVTVAGNDSGTLTLTGTAVAISNYINVAERILFNGPASTTAYALSVTVQSRDGSTVRSAVSSTAALTSVASGNPATTGNAQLAGAPTLNLAASLSVPSVGGELRLANLAGTSTESVMVLLSLSGGPASPSPAPTLSTPALVSSISVAGAGTNALTLTGTATAISTFLNTAGNVLFSGQASNTSYTLTATVQSVTAGVVRSARTAQATLTSVLSNIGGSATALAAPTLNLPASFAASAVNGSIRIADLTGNATTAVRVVLSVDAGPSGATPTLTSAAGNTLADGVTASVSTAWPQPRRIDSPPRSRLWPTMLCRAHPPRTPRSPRSPLRWRCPRSPYRPASRRPT
jgi:hypothetical protein